ncbi:TetR/AcrR family transcriptional regulator [Parasphingorhabdus sp. DH2-15]|uniref:TetR/AcrR family transcriptional regulator n=1 Tax=Parasphingorhabdus sp. DH2-15 TaxID=3444112 RepID=UPI003F683726
MPRPQLDPEMIRNEIMETAEEMIRQRGARDFSVSEIAAACDMSQSNFYRYFDSKEAFYEAMAERWFKELNAIMEDVIASDVPAKQKLFNFFDQRLTVKRARFEDDPKLFESYMEIGAEHFEVIRGYIDLADHYMAVIVAEAMAEGYFEGMEIDHIVSLINLMIQPFVNPETMMGLWSTATPENLRIIIDTLFNGLRMNVAHHGNLRIAS